jgi:single-stranded-DNA-specific exonuclease
VRSFGDFSAAAAVENAREILIAGGGHTAAAGVTIATEKLSDFRRRTNEFYRSLKLKNQDRFFEPTADVTLDDFKNVTVELTDEISRMEPFGAENLTPILRAKNLKISMYRMMGSENQHIKIKFRDRNGKTIEMISFGDAEKYKNILDCPNESSNDDAVKFEVYFRPTINEWNGRRSVEGRLLKINKTTKKA